MWVLGSKCLFNSEGWSLLLASKAVIPIHGNYTNWENPLGISDKLQSEQY